MDNEFTFKIISYNNSKQTRKLKSCLETWFKNPKDLNLTAPSLKYPFNFDRWVIESYSKSNTVSFTLNKDNWIIGYMSLQLQPNNDFIHLFHLFVDRYYRGKGFSKLLIRKAILFAKENDISAMTLFVNPDNQIAIKLYRTFGFDEIGLSKTGSLKMRLKIK